MRPYARALRTPGALLPLLASFVGSLLIGMLSLGVLLLVRLETGSFTQAGIVSGALGMGNAIGVAIQGGLIDRRGQTVVLVPAAALCTASLVLMVITLTGGGPITAIAVLAFAAGASIPATTTSMRTLWTALIPEPEERMPAYALLATMFTVAFLIAPLLVSAMLLLASPAAAVLLAAGFAAAAGLGFALTKASRQWRPTDAPKGWRPRGLATAGMRTLLIANAAGGVIAGMSGVALPAVAIALGSAALTGIFSATGAASDVIGGLWYGGRRWSIPLTHRLIAIQGCFMLTAVGMSIAAGSIPAMIVVLVIGGTLASAGGITTGMLLDRVALPGTLTESYATLVSAGLIGSSIGYTAGGSLVEAVGFRWVYVLEGAGMAVVMVWITFRRRSLAVEATHV